MRVGIIISRIGGEDGVGLETEKWIRVLHNMGQEVFLFSGKYERKAVDILHRDLLNELSITSKENLLEQEKVFLRPKENTSEVLRMVKHRSEFISKKIISWIKARKIDLLIVENACALPINLSMSIAIKKAVEKTRVKTITHDHDFYWERGQRYVSSYEEINEIVKKIIPLKMPNVLNIVINSPAKKILKRYYDLDRTILIPNVMDFNKRISCKRDFFKILGLKRNDIILLQATRVVRRKGIETAIELVHKLNDKRVKLVITGNNKDEKKADGDYFKSLKSLIKKFGLEKQVIFAGSKFKSSMLFDMYNCATACTYFSRYEGFGNAFVEAVLLRKPIFVNNYKPIFLHDIGKKGFRVVMTENNVLTNEAVEKIKKIIYDKNLQRAIAEYNFNLGKKYFSYEVLEKKLKKAISTLKKKRQI